MLSSPESAPRLTYGQAPALYASQFMLTLGDEQVLLDCSPGVMLDREAGVPTLPVHTRLALSWGGVKRLAQALAQALEQREARPASALRRRSDEQATASPAAVAREAQLPRLEVEG